MMAVPVAAEIPPKVTSTAPCAVPARIAETRPDQEGVPTRVLLGLYVLDIADVNDVEQSFTARFALRAQWKDARLTSLAGCKVELGDVWNPRLAFLNRGELVRTRPDMVEIGPQGMVTYTQGFDASLWVHLSLRKFPFDDQLLPFTIVAVEYGPEEVLFVVNERITARADRFSIPGWSIGPGSSQVGTWYFAPQDRNFSRFDYKFGATRLPGFYVWKVIFPLMLFVFMSWAVFWLDPAQLGTQIGLSATVMVICVIFMLNLGTVLPKVPYLTRVDRFVVGSLVLVFLALIEAVTSGGIAAAGKGELARKLDWWSRFIFPAAFVVVFIFAFFV
jgi:hypothetical protein